MPRFRCVRGAIAVWCAWSAFCMAGQTGNVRQGYKTPTFVVPYAQTRPTIDGIIDDAEWQGAFSASALQTTNKQVSARQTRWWMTWDEDILYVAMRSPLRDGERLQQALRDRKRDLTVVGDDSYEIWLDMGTIDPATGLVAFFQYLSNFDGSRLDVVHQPSVGNSSIAWTAGWQPKNRISPDGKAWEMEVAVPRASIYKNEPLADGLRFHCLLARNYKRPWEQNSIEGCSCFSSVEAWSQFVLAKNAPAIHLLSIADPAAQAFGVQLSAVGQADETIAWTFASDGGATKQGEIALKKGALVAGPSEIGLDKPGPGDYRIQVFGADRKTVLLDWTAKRAFGDLKALSEKLADRGDRVSLSLALNPVRNYVRVTGDFINYDDRAAIDHCSAAIVDSAGKALGNLDLKLDENAYIRGVVKLPALAFGAYKCQLTCIGKDGNEILRREGQITKKDEAKEFPWWNTQVGNIEKVIDPWTPVSLKDREIGVWGRNTKVGSAGLPEQITSQGLPLLAKPCRLDMTLATGATVSSGSATAKPISQAEHRVVVEAADAAGDLQVKTTVTAEFDGMYKVEMLLTPAKPIDIKALRVIIPLAPNVAEYLHGTGEGIRTGFDYAFVPKDKQGRVWDCREVDSQPMVVGSFFPYLWIGNTKGGIAWFADSDEGWIPNDKEPAIEVRRDSPESTDLVLNLVSAPATLDKPRTVVFALQATPVKPLAKGWRMDSWWCGDTFKDYTCAGDIIWTARPFTMDKAKCKAMVDGQHKGSNDFIFGAGTGSKANAVPYFIHQSLPGHVIPEVGYFGDEWRTTISECLYYGDTLTDYMIWNLHNWAKECGIDGYYIDNMRPVACDNLDAGRGWRLPDGRIQPTYQIFSTRRYFLRMRAAFHEAVGHSKVVLHMTNKMVMPWVQAADVAYDGEHHVLYPESGKDFIDAWSLERMRSSFAAQWGVPVNFMHEYQGDWKPAALQKAMRAYSGWVGLHDALPSGNANGQNTPFWIARHRFGIAADDVRFIGYWEADSGVSCADKNACLAAWVRPGKVLVLVVNSGEAAEFKINLDEKRLGLPAAARWRAIDAEEGTSLKRGKDDAWKAADETPAVLEEAVLRVTVKRHDYRQIIIEAK